MTNPITLVRFNGADGEAPYAGLIVDAAGNLYGTTYYGGANAGGEVFEIVKTADGYASTPTALVSFSPTYDSKPYAGLTADAAGDLFGTTSEGGPHGGGTVFEIAKTGGSYATRTLLSFSNINGESPLGGLIADAAGNLFGTTAGGGVDGGGTVFAIVNTGGNYASTPTILASFIGDNGQNTDGAFPSSGVIADAAGDLFGTTEFGGVYGDGTVFEIAKTGGSYDGTHSILFSFNGSNGADPQAGLIADAAGDLFGTTASGGAYGDGTVFKIAKTGAGYAGTPTTLVSFNVTDGETPLGGLIVDAAGDLFGTTASGGAGGNGAVFKIAESGGCYASTPTILASFTGSNGANPQAGLIADATGNLFGTTLNGGTNGGDGTVFEVTLTKVTAVLASPATGVEIAGRTITITVTFNNPVKVLSGTPTLTLNDGGTAFYDAAATATLADPTKLVFDYAVGSSASEHNVGMLTVPVNSLSDGAAIVDAAGDMQDFSGLATAFANLQVMVAPPATVTSIVASPASGVEGVGAAITITVGLSKAVRVSGGIPTLTLNDGGLAYYNAAATAALADPTKLVFDYAVGSSASEHNVDMLTVSANSLSDGIAIVDAAGDTPDFSGLATTFPNLSVAVAPTVTSVVASPSSGMEGIGATISITVGLSKAVTVAGGTPTLTLNDGGLAFYNAAATEALGDPTKLVYSYTVTASEHNVGALTVQDGSLNGSTVVDAVGNTPDFSALATVFANLQVVMSPTVTSIVASPSSGIETPGQMMTFTVGMSEAVTVSGGIPSLTLNDGGLAYYDAIATAEFGDPTKLIFAYTVNATPDEHSVGELAVQDSSLNGATISDTGGRTTNVPLIATVFSGLEVELVRPATVIGVTASSPSGGMAGLGETVAITLSMSSAVRVSGGTPSLALNDGGTATYDATATAALGDPTKLVFDYTVGVSDEFSNNSYGSYQPTIPGLAVVGGSFNGATIEDTASTIPDFSGSLQSLPLQVVDAPVVTSVAATPAAGEVLNGSSVGIDLHMSEAVAVTGTPELLLNDGGTALYDPAHSSATDLHFIYQVGPEVTTDLQVTGIEPLPRQSWTITDSQGRGANLSGAGADLGLQVNTASTGNAGESSGNFMAGALELFGPSTAAVSFGAVPAPGADAGVLKLDDSQGFAGTVAGFNPAASYSETVIDFADIPFGANTTVAYSQAPGAADGMLTVSDGSLAAKITLLGNYSAASFVTFDDHSGHTAVQNPAAELLV